MTAIAYCGADGALHFGPAVPPGMLCVARCPTALDTRTWQDGVVGWCRVAHKRNKDDKAAYLIPGMPEAPDQQHALDVLMAFSEVLYQVGLDHKVPGRKRPTLAGKDRAFKKLRELNDPRNHLARVAP